MEEVLVLVFSQCFSEFFGIPFVKVVEGKGLLRVNFRGQPLGVGKSDGSINRGKGMVAILKGGYTTNVSVIGEVGRYFYRSSNSGTRKSVVDYEGQEGSSHPLTEKLFPPSADSSGPPDNRGFPLEDCESLVNQVKRREILPG